MVKLYRQTQYMRGSIHKVDIEFENYQKSLKKPSHMEACFMAKQTIRGPMVLSPVNAHLISGPSISINHTKPD